MQFTVEGKVALVTGGVSGIGLSCARELLKNGLRAVTLVDVNAESGAEAVVEITKEFGPNRVLFVEADVTNLQRFEEAFRSTVNQFKNLDIVINNAGIVNDAIWEKEIAINLNGVIHGTLLGLENYIPKYRTGSEGVIVNVSSLAGVEPFSMLPIYTGTKFAVFGLTQAFGHDYHYQRTKIKVVAVCPGATHTAQMAGLSGSTLGPAYENLIQSTLRDLKKQQPVDVALGVVKIIKEAKSGTGWIVEDAKEPYKFELTPREKFAPN